jgi:hypothetical protein
MWQHLMQFLIDLEASIIRTLGTLPTAMRAVQISTALRGKLCQQGKSNGAWPSTIRNAINYRHEFGIWYPYSQKQAFCDTISARMSRWRPSDSLGFDITQGGDDLAIFADICNVLNHLLTATLKDISARAPRCGSSFVDRFPFKLLREREVTI